jgi:hypothetical protein
MRSHKHVRAGTWKTLALAEGTRQGSAVKIRRSTPRANALVAASAIVPEAASHPGENARRIMPGAIASTERQINGDKNAKDSSNHSRRGADLPDRRFKWPQRPSATIERRPPRASSSATPTTRLSVVRALFAARNPEIPTTRKPITKGGLRGVSWAPGIAETIVSKSVCLFAE